MAISHELGLKLKEKGFPQQVGDGVISLKYQGGYNQGTPEEVYLPSGDELIEICRGEKINGVYTNELVIHGLVDGWIVELVSTEEDFVSNTYKLKFVGRGQTLTEALAYLYLHINLVRPETRLKIGHVMDLKERGFRIHMKDDPTHMVFEDGKTYEEALINFEKLLETRKKNGANK